MMRQHQLNNPRAVMLALSRPGYKAVHVLIYLHLTTCVHPMKLHPRPTNNPVRVTHGAAATHVQLPVRKQQYRIVQARFKDQLPRA